MTRLAPIANPKIAFLHIPRTGGTTFRSILKQVYGSSYHYCTHDDPSDILRDLEKYQCVALHWHDTGFVHERLLADDQRRRLAGVTVLTVFREPIAQVRSTYSYIQCRERELRVLFKRLGRPFPETFQEFLELEPGNQQLAALLGRKQTPAQRVGDADLEDAKRWISQVDIKVGSLEQFEVFLHLFETITGRKIPDETLKIENSSPRSSAPEIDDATRQRVMEKNVLDRALYAFARKLAAKQAEEFPPRRRTYRFE